MNKLESAQRFAEIMLEHLYRNGSKIDSKEISEKAFILADAMQAEADKRTQNEPRATHKNLEKFTMHPEYDATINYPHDAWVTYNGEARLAVSIKEDSLRKRPQ